MSEKNVAKTIITLRLPTPHGGGIPEDERTATLLIQRGDLGQARQFYYHGLLEQIVTAIHEATEALGLIEDNPPLVPDLPEEKKKSKTKKKAKAVVDSEPTVDVPLKKGSLAVKMSYIKIIEGENDAVAYRQAILLAGRLIDGKLWDGESPIQFGDVHELAKRMKPLSDKDFSMFTLADFVSASGSKAEGQQIAEVEEPVVEEPVVEEPVVEVLEAEVLETKVLVVEVVDEAKKPYFELLRNNLFADVVADTEQIKTLTKLAERIAETVEGCSQIIDFWNSPTQVNQLKADLQNMLLSPEFNHLPTIIEKRIQIIEAILDEAKATGENIPGAGEENNYPDRIDSPAKREFYDVLQNEELAEAIFEDIISGMKHDWKGNLIKERLIKGIIAAYVDGKAEQVEKLFDIALKSSEFDTAG